MEITDRKSGDRQEGDKALKVIFICFCEGRRKREVHGGGKRVKLVNFAGGPTFPSATTQIGSDNIRSSKVKCSPRSVFPFPLDFLVEQVNLIKFPHHPFPSPPLTLSGAKPKSRN